MEKQSQNQNPTRTESHAGQAHQFPKITPDGLVLERRRWETATRYYETILCRDLFDLVLIRCNGGRGTKLGSTRVTPGTHAELQKLIGQTAKTRIAHGYHEVDIPKLPKHRKPRRKAKIVH